MKTKKLWIELFLFLLFILQLLTVRYAFYKVVADRLNVDQLDVKAALEPFKELDDGSK